MSGPRTINIQAHSFKSDLRTIAKAMMQHLADPHLGNPKGANVKVEDDLGIITIGWAGRGKTFEVDHIVPPRLWEASKVAKQQNQFVARCIVSVRDELNKMKARHLP